MGDLRDFEAVLKIFYIFVSHRGVFKNRVKIAQSRTPLCGQRKRL